MYAASSHPVPRSLRLAGAALVAGWILLAGYSLAPFGGSTVHDAFTSWLYDLVLLCSGAACVLRAVLIAHERRIWLAMGGGLIAWTAGEIYYTLAFTGDAEVPIPSPADIGYLALYPAAFTAVALLLRSRIATFTPALWLDGVITGLAAASLAAALVLGPIVDASTGTDTLAVGTNLAYPIADLVLLALVVTAFGLTGWRPGRTWILLGSGLAVTAVADVVYLFESARGSYTEGGPLDAVWPACAVLIAFAAWSERTAAPRAASGGARMVAVPVTAALVSIGLGTYDHFTRLSTGSIVLASLTLVGVAMRLALSFQANQRLLAASRHEAASDALTGLANRRSLMRDLELAVAQAREPGRARLLVLLDLDGFKAYNDAFGHPAGDALLVRLGARLGLTAAAHGRAYRLGGDEFCVLADCPSPVADVIPDGAASALSERGEGFEITASYGSVRLHDEATDASAAMQMADTRMYAKKGRGRISAGNQSRAVLVSTLREAQPDLHAHVTDVAELAVTVAARLGMSAEAQDEVGRAGELHDVGKVAIPDAILQKPGPLDADEWEFMRRHTVIGQRIIDAAPALRPVATLVRSSHERWDGGGYPDGLAGEHIPLGARIVAVCDAYDAMIATRPYRQPMTRDGALEELERSAGTQFDPTVVHIFAAAVRDPVRRAQPATRG